MEAAIIGNASLEDLQKHKANFASYSEGGDQREAFIGRQEDKFKAADQANDNEDQTLTIAEFPILIDTIFETFGVEKSEANLNHFFSEIDADKDGNISHAEYFAWLDSKLKTLSAAVDAELAKRGQ
eukprot:403338181